MNSTVDVANVTDGLDDMDGLDWSGVKAVISAVRLVVVLFGILTNLLVVVVVSRDRSLRHTANYFVASMALVDALTLLSDAVIFIPKDFFHNYLFSITNDTLPTVLKLNIYNVGNTLMVIGTTNLIIICLDRYIYIQRPFMYGKVRRGARLAIAASWLVPAVLYTLIHLYVTVVRPDYEPMYTVINMAFHDAAFLSIIVLYFRIFATARGHRRAIGRQRAQSCQVRAPPSTSST